MVHCVSESRGQDRRSRSGEIKAGNLRVKVTFSPLVPIAIADEVGDLTLTKDTTKSCLQSLASWHVPPRKLQSIKVLCFQRDVESSTRRVLRMDRVDSADICVARSRRSRFELDWMFYSNIRSSRKISDRPISSVTIFSQLLIYFIPWKN